MVIHKKIRIIVSLFIIFNIIFLPIAKATNDSIYVWNNNGNKIDTSNRTTDAIQTTAEASNNVPNKTDTLGLTSGSAILIEQNTGRILYGKNIHEKLRPASVTKVMTILLIMEAIDSGKLSYSDKIPCSQNATKMGGSQIWLDTKETLTVDEMLKAICVVSANDCTVAMAEYLAGSTDAFVEKMNKRAKELGMNDTTFKNCHGLDEDGHLTSSYDIAQMSRELLTKHPDIKKYTTIWMDSLRDGKSQLVNTNKLIRNYTGATGLKTGSTSLALYNLSASATRNNLSLIAVIMKAPTTKDRFNEAEKLLDYGFNNFSYKQLSKKGEEVGKVTVIKGIEKEVKGIIEKDCGTLLKKGEEKGIVQDIRIDENKTAPILKGQKIGEITYSLNGTTLEKVNIIAEKDVPKIAFTSMLSYIVYEWFTLFRS